MPNRKFSRRDSSKLSVFGAAGAVLLAACAPAAAPSATSAPAKAPEATKAPRRQPGPGGAADRRSRAKSEGKHPSVAVVPAGRIPTSSPCSQPSRTRRRTSSCPR